jgi:HK97 gp10 family phage protein
VVSDLRTFANKLGNLVDKREVMQRALYIVQRQAMKDAPVGKSGHLRRTHTTRVLDGGNRGVVGVSAGYGRYVHEGTGIYGPKKKKIVPKTKKALAFVVGGKKLVRRSVKGMKARPWLRNALVKTRVEVEQELGSIVERAWARLV